MYKIAVILFPGINCELESLRTVARTGMEPQLVRWNEEVDYSKFDGFFIPGGFSYEDRGRSGIIASKNPLVDEIAKEAAKGKPVIGVCNGAQVVVEAGLIPGLDKSNLEMGLAWNKRVDKDGNILGTGFYNDWIYIKNAAPKGRTAFNNYDEHLVLRIPIAHGEGRFTSMDPEMEDNLIKNQQTVFKYCDENGEVRDEFPYNPNGAMLNAAGICNPEGNVLSIMPHPERTEIGDPIFDSMREYIGESYNMALPADMINEKPAYKPEQTKSYKQPDIEIFVDTVITDNEERTLERAIHDIGFKNAKLKKLLYYGIETSSESDPKETANQLLKSGEIVNMAKEVPLIKINNKYYSFDINEGLTQTDEQEKSGESYLTFNKEDTTGQSIMQTIRNHFSIKGVAKIHAGKKWIFPDTSDKTSDIIDTYILHNPHSMDIYKA